MPIHNPADYSQVIARIKAKVVDQGIQMGPPLAEAEIQAFEEECQARLPEAYRMFLMEVGDGTQMYDTFSMHRLSEVPREDLSRPFRLEDAWIWEAEETLTSEEISARIEEEVDHGTIELIDVGCGMTYELVVTGPCRGEVWSFADVGVCQCCERQDFLGWFELWVDNQDDTDYFKDYVY